MRVLLAEDDPMIADVLIQRLREDAHVVEHVGDGWAARDYAPLGGFDVVLLDLGLPGLDGMDVLRGLRRGAQDGPAVIVMTARGRLEEKVAGLDAGADDYLVKPYDPGELLARLRAVERRRSAEQVPLLQLGDLQIDLAREQVRRSGVPIALTQKEWALLRVLATRPDRIQTRDSLQDALYGFDDEADSNTLEVFISNLRRKLGRDRIQTLRGLGYKLNTSAVA